jgi:hypothetical protein
MIDYLGRDKKAAEESNQRRKTDFTPLSICRRPCTGLQRVLFRVHSGAGNYMSWFMHGWCIEAIDIETDAYPFLEHAFNGGFETVGLQRMHRAFTGLSQIIKLTDD